MVNRPGLLDTWFDGQLRYPHLHPRNAILNDEKSVLTPYRVLNDYRWWCMHSVPTYNAFGAGRAAKRKNRDYHKMLIY